MSEALSQSQIDELLSKMKTGAPIVEEKEETKLKKYDFTSPKKFTKDQLKSLNGLYENYGRLLAGYFTGVLRDVCDIEIEPVEEQRFFEFNNALPDNTLLALISFKPNNDDYEESIIMMHIPTAFGFLLIDRMMGSEEELYAPEREFTEIELAILSYVLEEVTKYLKEAWSNFFELEVSLLKIETNARLLQIYSSQDIVVITPFDVKTSAYTGTINICMQANNLEKVVESFSIKYAQTKKPQAPHKEKKKKELLYKYIKKTDLEIDVVLETCKMSFGDILKLQKNDVIQFNKKIDSNVDINVEGATWYNGRIGEVSKNKAVKIVNTLRDETEEIS